MNRAHLLPLLVLVLVLPLVAAALPAASRVFAYTASTPASPPYTTPTPTKPPVTPPLPTPVWYFPPHVAYGTFDTANSAKCYVNGWSLDTDHKSASNQVQVYINGPVGKGTYLTSAVANQPRPDVNKNTGVAGNHGFYITLSQFRAVTDGKPHTLYIYGVRMNTGLRDILFQNPKTITCPTVTPTPTPTCTIKKMRVNGSIITICAENL